MASITTRQTQAPQGQPQATVAGVPLTNTQLDNNFIALNTELSEKLPLTGGTLTGTLNYRMLASQTTSNYDTAGDSSGFSVFYATNAATSKPTGTDHAVTTLSYSDLWQVQEASDWRTNARYIRKQENGVWSAWQRLYADDYHPNADTLTTARTISLTGDVTGSVSFNGSSNVSISATIAANSVALGTDTTGNYVVGLTAGTGITISGTAGEGWSPTITHSDTSTQASVDNANGTVIQDITLDGFGHITGIGSVDLDGRYYTETEADGRFVNVTGDTMTGSLVHGLNLAAKFGDTVADNYSDVYHYSGTAGVDHIGFPNQHGNAFVIINQQGSTNQSLILGDTDNGTGTGVLFGIGHTSDGGTTWSKRLELLGTGSFKRDGNLIWDAGNDGTGSGLDADLLDGQHGSYYLDWTNVTNKPDPVVTVTLTGDVTGTANTTLTDLASGTISVATTIAANSVALGTDTTGNYVVGLTAGTGITITGTAGEGWSPTVTVDGTSTNTANKVVIRDASGNFSAGTITAALSGNATTATTWQTARTITLGGDLTGNVSINGSANVTLTATVVDNSHNHTSLTGVTSIAFASQSTDVASITTTIGTTETFFDFNLADDNNNDYWRWRFTPSGSTVYDAMVLKPVANGVADLTVSGSIITPDNIPLVFTSTSVPTIDNTAASTGVGFRMRKGGSSNAASSTYGVLHLARTNHDNTSTTDGSTLYFVLKDDTGTEREYAGIGGQKTVAGASGGQLNFYNYNRNQLGYWNGTNLFLNTQIAFNDVSRYWLSTATNWGVYWDTTDNRIEFHGAGVDRWGVDLDNGNSVQVGSITADSAEFTGLGTNGDPGTDDLYVGGYGIQGSRASAPVYVHNHAAGGVRISSGATLGTVNGILVEANQTTVTGLLTATSKSFTIPHPTKPGKKLRHGSLEGPEHGVYVRGKIKGNIIQLPEYWTKLVDPDSITVQLTAIGKGQKLYVEEIRDNKVYIANDGMFASEPHCFYLVQAERVDIEKMQVEIEE